MIEDINERMTQFAPSQNNPLNDDPIAEEIAIARQVTPQTDAATIDVDPIAEEIAQSRRDLMMATFGSAADANPDQAAQAKKLGEQFGVGADIAGRNMQQLKKQALLDELERRDLMRRDPILARYLSNHDFAAMAHDDIDNLSKTEDLFQGSWFARYEDPIAYGKKTISMIDERFRRGRAIVEMGRANDLLGLRAQWSPDPRKASEISEELKKLTTEGGIVGAGVEVVGQMLEGIPEVAETTAMGATTGGAVGAVGGPAGFVTIPAGMLTGAGAGFAAGSARSAFMAESGNSYQQMIEQGYDPEVARKAAIGVGVVNASIEMISFGALGPVLRKLGVNVFRPAVANALAKPTAAKALATLGGDYAKAVAAGASEEFLQEIATGIGDDIARVYGSSSPSRILDEGGITDLLGTALESGVQGAMGMAILGGIGPVANFRYDMRRAGAAERQQAFFERLSSTAVDSKLRGRDMNAFERFVASQAEGTEAETIFVDAAAMQGVLRQSNLSDEQIDEALPGVREQLQAAAQTGGDVTLPTAAFAARVAGTDLGNAMLPHVRLAPDAMSVTEAQEFQKNRDQLVEQARVIMEEKGRADDAFVQEARAIEDRIYQEVVATGTMDENAARANATFVRDLYVTMAARMNTTPAALEQRFPYRVEAQGVAITEPLEQADQFDQAGERRTDTPEFKAWSNNAPIVQGEATEFATRQPFAGKAYHGSPITDITEFDPFAPSRFRKELERGMGAIWFGAEPATATNFAGMSGSVYPVYVTLQNPLVVDAAKEAQPDLYVRLQGGQTIYDIQYIKAAAIARAKREGHDGVVFVNAYDGAPVGGKATIYAIFNPTDIKSVNNRGTWSRATANIMQQAATMDAEYMAAVERGDMATAQRMVDEAARANGYTIPVYHFTDETFTSFDVQRGRAGRGIWVTSSPEGWFGNNRLNLYLNPGTIENVKSQWDPTWREGELSIEGILEGDLETMSAQNIDTLRNSTDYYSTFYVATRPEQLKSADPVTYDEAGNVIPLSRRFDITSPRMFEQAAKDAAVSQLAMTAQRGRRTTSGDVVITPEEEQILENFIDIEIERQIEKERKKFAKEEANASKTPEELDKALQAHDTKLRKQLKKKFMATAAEDKAAVRETLIRHKSAHPVEQGWAFLELGRVVWIDKGDGKGKWENQYKIIPYAFERDEDGNTLVPQTKEYNDRVNALASRMTDEVLAVHTRAMAGDDNAAKIIRQARWYYAMRTRLRQEFGGLGDLFADLLGATSPNTPVRDNWYNAVDALRRAMRGDWDEMLPKWIEWVEKIEELELAMRAYLDNGIALGRSVADIQRDSKYAKMAADLKEARKFPEELYPLKENEAKYGFNGKNIVRAMVDLWRTIRDEDVQIGRGATAPKALNFSGNLIGFRQRATIDVWAARELQRLAGLARIPSMAEAGVAGAMLSTGATTGQFGFGQDVFAEAVKKIRSHPVLSKVPELAKINDDDLQALVWFVEKELWTINDWTSTAGEGGSFELEASLTGTNRQEWVKGLRRILDAAPPRALVDTAAKKPAAAAARKAWEPQREILAKKLEELEATRKRAMEAKRSPKKADPADLRTKEQIEEIDADIKATKASLKATRPLDTALNQATTAEVRLEVFNIRKRKAAVLLTKLERTVDRFTGGLSEQQSLDTQGVEYIPTDADMAMLSEALRTAIYETDNGATVLASKVLATEGRYGSIERSMDIEAVVRQGYDIRPLWLTMLKRAKAANQDSTFLSRILRVGEIVDPLYHRPGVEIYFRTSIEPSKLQQIIDKLRAKNVDMFTVIVDGRRLPGTMAGEMGNAVGVRFQYIPEFDQRYGGNLTNLSDDELRETVSSKAAEMERIVAAVLADVPEVSSALQLWHETRVAFASQYDEEIRNAGTVAVGAVEGVGAPARAGVWRGQSVRDGIERADRHAREAAKRKPDGADGQAVAGIQQPGVLQQAAPGPARGGFDPSRLTTILNKNADLSTFIHETAHFYLTILGNLAADPAATPEIRADMDTLLKWFGVAGDTDAARLAAWNAMSVDEQRKYHEQFAYSFEIYMFEGKSPSAEMQGLFDRFSAWLKRVYRSIRDDLNAIYRREFGEDLPLLTGEVRQVMDRMLASEEQIKRQAAINEMKPMFQTQEQSGMDDAEWAAYQQMQQEAVEAAVTDMNKASLRQMQWLSNARARILRDLQSKHAKQRKEIREEVAEEIRRQPLYRAMEYLRTGTFTDADGEAVKMEGAHRLDMESVRQMYELEPENLRPDIAKLGTGGRGMMGMNGIDPDVAAELFGFSSGDELIRALIEAQPMKEAIDARTDELMLERFSELSTPEGREAKVQESLHNEARARFVAVELRFVAKATQPARVLVEAAKQAAREMIAGKRIADLRPSEFIAAEARAARAAAKIGKPVNVDTVAKAAETRAMNIAREQGLAPDEVMAAGVEAGAIAQQAAQARLDEQRAQYGADPAQALIRAKRAQLYQNQLAAEALAARDEVEKGVRYLRQVMRDSNVKRMGADVADQIDRILERFNLRPMSAKRMAERQSLVQWLESLKESGLEPDLAPEILDEAARKPYREMTVAEFRDLVDAVKQLEYIGKNAQKIKRAQEMAEFEEVRDEIVASVRGNFTGKETKPRSPTTSMGKRIAKAKRFLYSHLKAAAIARIMDGGQDDGPVWNFLIRTANEAGDMETRMRAEATKRLTEILAPVFALGKMGGKGIYFDTVGMSLNREARLVIALNMGNDGNRQRLLDGEGWTLEQVQPILESLTEAEWKAVQDVWDYMESFRPLVGAKERRLYGREPKWVTPVPFTVRTADGKEVRLSGGYYPIKYDPIATERAETADEAEKARTELRGAYTAATTRRSFTKARAAKVEDRPLLYTMTGVYSGINDVIHDLAWHEWLIQANRLMRDEKFDRAVRETYGAEFKSQLKGWIKDVAAGERGAEDAADMFASYIRRSVSAAGLGFNIVSAILQVTGFSQSIVRVGAKHIARGVAATTASPLQTMKFVNEKSSFMQERARTQFRELNELRNMVGDESAAQRRLRLGTYFLMMRMQRMVDVPTWVGAYEKALEAGKDDATAVALADQAVIDSQGGGMLKDLSKIERGGALSKLFTVFYSYMNTVYNMAAVSTMTPRSRGRLAADYAMLFIVPVVLNYALKKALTPDVDDEEPDMEKIATDLVAEELAFLMGTMVGVREFQNAANAVVGKETAARGYEGPAGLRAIGEAGRFAVQAKQLEFDRAFRRSAINMLGIGLGLPSAQINRTIDGVEALAEGETENPFAVLTGVQR